MFRSGSLAFTLLLTTMPSLLQAQKAMPGTPAGGPQVAANGAHNPGVGLPIRSPHRSGLNLNHRNREGFGAIWFPWGYDDYFFDDEYVWNLRSNQQYQPPMNPPPPQVIVLESKDSRPSPPVEPPKLTEAPESKQSSQPTAQSAKTIPEQHLPATMFVLKNGERLESRYYLLTDQLLKVEVAQQQRVIPVSNINIDATMAANHERGIELTVPRNRNTLFLSF